MYRYISQSPWTFQQLRELERDTAGQFVGIRILAIGPDFVMADMPVDERTRRPFGLLHGGMSMVLAETLGSLGSMLLVADEPDALAVGVDIGGSHLNGVRSGRVTGICCALKLGRSMHFWRIDIWDQDRRLCCSANLTVRVLRGKGAAGG